MWHRSAGLVAGVASVSGRGDARCRLGWHRSHRAAARAHTSCGREAGCYPVQVISTRRSHRQRRSASTRRALPVTGPRSSSRRTISGRFTRSTWTGAGKTIIIVDSFGSPTIKSDLATFDKAFNLPAPQLTILQPAGKVPPFDPANATMVGWAEETSLDVEYSHAMAPGANIVLLETPVAETEGTVGFPEIIAAENFAINHHLGDVISQSFGATEQTFPSPRSIMKLRTAYINAAKHNVSVLASSGDTGVSNDHFNGTTLYTHRVVGVAVERPAGHLGRRSAAAPQRQGRRDDAGQRVERELPVRRRGRRERRAFGGVHPARPTRME